MDIPNNTEAEKALLGCILLNNNLLDEIMDTIKTADFYRQSNGIIYSAMVDLHNKNTQIDLVTLGEYLNNTKLVDKAGGLSYVTALGQNLITTLAYKDYVSIIKNKSVKRKLLRAVLKVQEIANSDLETDQVLDKAGQIILSISDTGTDNSVKDAKSLIMETFSEIENECEQNTIHGLQTGFKDLDNKLLGIQNGELVIIAARPAMGKTAFALNIAANLVITQQMPVLFFQLEMSRKAVMKRFISAGAVVEANKIKTGTLTANDWTRMNAFCNKFYNSEFYLADTPCINILKLRSIARREKRLHGIKAIFIDYLQQIDCSNIKTDNKNYQIAEITRQLKQLARELDIPVIVLSQLSRDVEKRQDKHPMLSDLRDSGAIEQDADIVMFLYRDDYYNPDTEQNKNLVEVNIAKHRDGAVATASLYLHKDYLRFQDIIKNS